MKPAFDSPPRPGKRLRVVGSGVAFLALLTVGILLWRYYQWPLDPLDARFELGGAPELDRMTTLVLHSGQGFQRTQRLGVEASLTGGPFDVQSARLMDEDGKAVFQFQITPRAVVHEREIRGEFRLRNRRVGAATLSLTVPMPLFYRTEEQSYLEMVTAPAASIYGSHITVWNELEPGAEVFLVTGHAASSVCRVASAALVGLAYETDVDSPHFVLGAGVGEVDVTGLQKQVETDRRRLLEDFPEIAAQLDAAARQHATERSPGQRLLEEFRRTLDQRETSEPDAASEEVEDAPTAADLEAAREQIAPSWLNSLDEAVGTDLDAGVAVPRERLQALAPELDRLMAQDWTPVSRLSDAELEVVRELLEEPGLALAVLAHRRTEQMEDALAVRRGLAPERRATFDKALRRLVERARAFDTANRNLAELRERTGLVLQGESTLRSRSDLERVAGRVADWARQGAAGAVELSALAAGHEGCILLPFFDRTGTALEFTLDESLLGTDEHQNWRRLIQNNTAVELVAVAREIHARAQKQAGQAEEQMQRTAAPGRGLAGTDLRLWLAEEQDYTISLYDEKFRIVGTRKERQSRLQTLLNAWNYAFSVRASDSFYGRMVQSVEGLHLEPRFQRISDATLLDSLLRGWKLAFADDEAEKRYEEWSRQARNAVWARLWEQATARGLDARFLRTEATVFQIARRGDDLVIRPRFVADIVRTHCVRSDDGQMIGYRSAWLGRQPVAHAAADPAPTAQTPEDLAQLKLVRIREAVDTALAEVRTGASDERTGRFVRRRERFAEQAENDLQVALCAAPERAVAGLVREVLALWPEPPAAAAVTAEQRQRSTQWSEWENFAGDINDRWRQFGPSLLAGTWPFADHYLGFAEIWRMEAQQSSDADQAERGRRHAAELTAKARTVDAAFVEAAGPEPVKALQEGSPRLREARHIQSGLDGERVVEALHLVTLLQEASRAFEGWDDEGQNVLLLEELAAEFAGAAAEVRTALAAELASLTELLELEDFDPVQARPLLEGMARYAAADIAEPGRLSEALRWRISHLAGRLERSPGRRPPDSPEPSTKPRVLAALRECQRLLGQVPPHNWLREVVDRNRRPLDDLIGTITKDRDYDAIDRQKHRHEGNEIAEVAIVRVRGLHERAPTRRTLEMLVQIEWGLGLYRAAFDTLLRETMAQDLDHPDALEAASDPADEDADWAEVLRLNPLGRALGWSAFDPEDLRRLRNFEQALGAAAEAPQNRVVRAAFYGALFQANRVELLKACVYSGGEFFGASIFGRRQNDWVHKPRTLAEVIVRLDEPEAPGLTEATGQEFARLYAEAVANPPTVLAAPRAVGPFPVVEAIPASFTDLRVFKVTDAWGNPSIIKVLPNDAAGHNRREMQATVQMADYLARQGIEVPAILPAHSRDGGKVLETSDAVIIRETLAPGTELGQLAKAQGGQLTPEQQRLYVEATLDCAVRGRDLPDAIARKPAVQDRETMRQKLTERLEESRAYFDLFAQTPLYQQTHGPEVAAKGRAFHDRFQRYLDQFWRGDAPLQEVGLVHDAITRNYFLDGPKLTLIDVGSDYVGSVGHLLGILATQLQPPGKAWPYSEFKAKVGELLDQYAARVGRPLTEAQRTEIIQHLPVQPYRMLSSDSGSFLVGLRRACGLPDQATVVELAAAVRRQENLAKVEDFLADPELREKYERHMTLIEHSFRLLAERLPDSALEDRNVLSDLLHQTRQAREEGLRVVLCSPPPVPSGALAAAR